MIIPKTIRGKKKHIMDSKQVSSMKQHTPNTTLTCIQQY